MRDIFYVEFPMADPENGFGTGEWDGMSGFEKVEVADGSYRVLPELRA
ncbi:hypothetical protein ACG2F4_15165 [Halalkalibaculum sp. DA3122]